MSTTVRLVKKPSSTPGDMWFSPAMVEGEYRQHYLDHYLSNEYKRDWLGKRPPLTVVLPCGSQFCLDAKATDHQEDGQGWTVTGEPPNVSVTPSIVYSNDMPDGSRRELWHGFLTNGEMNP